VFRGLDRDFAAMEVVEVRPMVMRRVPPLVTRAPLRGYDAVQLASALALSAHGVAVDFWSADERLVAAAAAQGLRASRVG
jgi:predicted nucleic acid-binding protein